MATNDHIGNKALARDGVLDGNLSYYVIPVREIKNKGNNGSTYFDEESQTTITVDEMLFIPSTDDVISCYYYPYLSYNGLGTEDVYFDYVAYPLALEHEQLQKDLILHRINNIGTNSLTDIGRFPKYCVSGTDIGGAWKWQNEGKLWLPPFTTCIAYDGLSEPMEINPMLFNNDLDTFAISVRHSLNHLGAYTLYVEGYRGDSLGKVYGHTCTGLSIPITSNAYTEYMHDNQFKLKQSRWSNCINGMSGVLSNAISRDWGGVLSTTVNTYLNHLNMKGTINQTKLSGYQLTGEGSNAIHDLQFNGGMNVFYHQYLEEYMKEVGYYFHRYGYAQNKFLTPNINSRKYFNYLKGEVVMQSTGIPSKYMADLSRQFHDGATVWHMDAEDNFIGNYLPDNVEV